MRRAALVEADENIRRAGTGGWPKSRTSHGSDIVEAVPARDQAHDAAYAIVSVFGNLVPIMRLAPAALEMSMNLDHPIYDWLLSRAGRTR